MFAQNNNKQKNQKPNQNQKPSVHQKALCAKTAFLVATPKKTVIFARGVWKVKRRIQDEPCFS